MRLKMRLCPSLHWNSIDAWVHVRSESLSVGWLVGRSISRSLGLWDFKSIDFLHHLYSNHLYHLLPDSGRIVVCLLDLFMWKQQSRYILERSVVELVISLRRSRLSGGGGGGRVGVKKMGKPWISTGFAMSLSEPLLLYQKKKMFLCHMEMFHLSKKSLVIECSTTRKIIFKDFLWDRGTCFLW